MSAIVWAKNTSGAVGTWVGQQLADLEYYLIAESERLGWAENDKVLTDVGSGDLTLAYDNTGTTDISEVNTAIDLLKNIDPNPRNSAKRTLVHQTSRDPGFTTYFASGDDDDTSFLKYGGTTNIRDLLWHHEIGDPVEGSIYFDMNTIDNETHIHEGYLQWKDALNDYVTLEFVPKTTTTSAGTNTNYDLFGGYLVVPAAPGTGSLTVQDANRVLVQVSKDLDSGGSLSAGYFDADFNTSTGLFENIAPNYTGTGEFNMFAVEVTLSRFVNRMRLLGSGFMAMQTSDKSMLGHGVRMKMTYCTHGADHDWWGNASITFHRRKMI